MVILYNFLQVFVILGQSLDTTWKLLNLGLTSKKVELKQNPFFKKVAKLR